MTLIRRMTLLALLVISLAPSSAGAKGGRMPTLYMLEPLYGRVLQPLDPATLQPTSYTTSIVLGNISSVKLASQPPANLLLSPAGAMLARVVDSCSGCQALHSKYITIRVTNLSTGRQVARFHPHIPMYDFSYLSDDGGVMAGMRGTATGVGWTAISTRTGRVLHRFSLPSDCCTPLDRNYDAQSDRLYTTAATSSHQLELRAYSGTSGSMVADLTLPNVMDGTWRQAGDAAAHMSQPGVALSADGKRIAVFDGATQTVTMVDVPALRVIQTLTVSQPTSAIDKIGQALGIFPTAAEAKGPMPTGAMYTARLSHDGHSLFVSGTQAGKDAQENPAWVSTGLQRIDLATGQLTESTLGGTDLQWWAEAGDGSAVYTLSRTTDDQAACPCVLRSHDPSTLKVITEREFIVGPPPQLFIIGGGGII